MNKIRKGEYRSKWNDVYILDTNQSYNLLRVLPPNVVYGILIRKVGGRNIINCAFAHRPENQRIRAPAGFTLGMPAVEREQVAEAINEESDTADRLLDILKMIQ